MTIDPVWAGVIYLCIGIFTLLSTKNLLKVISGILMTGWGLVLFFVLFVSSGRGKKIDEIQIHSASFLILATVFLVYAVGLSLVYRRKVLNRELDEPMKELKH